MGKKNLSVSMPIELHEALHRRAAQNDRPASTEAMRILREALLGEQGVAA